MVGVVLDELEVNAVGAAFDFWLQHLDEELRKRNAEPQTPTRDEAIDALETAIIHAISARLHIVQALEDDYPLDMSFQRLVSETRDLYGAWTESERREAWGR